MNRALLIGTLSVILTVLLSSCNPSPSGNMNAASPTASSASTPATTPAASPGSTPNAEKTGTKGPHCDDPPHENTSKCKRPIDNPFVVGCTVGFTGQSHDIGQDCANEGPVHTETDKAQ